MDQIAANRAIETLHQLKNNFLSLSRDSLFRGSEIDPRRSIDDECGYPKGTASLTAWDYQDMYEKESIAARVVECLPRESWQVQPSVYEDPDPENVTKFEKAWDELGGSLLGEQNWYKQEEGSPIWNYLRRADEVSGIGRYGVIFLGLDDGEMDLSKPVKGVEEENSAPIEFEYANDADKNKVGPPEKESDPTNPKKLTKNEFITPKKIQGRWKSKVEKVTGWHKIIFNAEKLESDTTLDSSAAYSDPGSEPSQPFGGKGKSKNGKEGKEKEGKEGKGKNKLRFLRVFPETLAEISAYEGNYLSDRFQQPVMYRITFNDPRTNISGIGLPTTTREVHWTRVIHICDNASSNEVHGTPRMQTVFNRLYDLRKIYGADGESYWRSAVMKLFLETHPELGGDVDVDVDAVKDDFEQMENSLQKMMLLRGLSAKAVPPAVSDPTPHVNVHIEAICIKLGIPIRIFKGSERGELASSQDDASWNDRLRFRQNDYITPRIIVPFINRLIWLGVLPKPNEKPKDKKRLKDVLSGGMGGNPMDPMAGGGMGETDPFAEQDPFADDSAADPFLEGAVGEEEEPTEDEFAFETNAFCATGDGGGIDNSCAPNEQFGDVKIGTYKIEKARYAKGKVAVRADSDDGWKSREQRIAEGSGGKWSNREKAYIMSPTQAKKMLERFARGDEWSPITKEWELPRQDDGSPGSIYSVLKSGKPIKVKSPNGETFEIRPKSYGGATGYGIFQGGKKSKGHRMMRDEELKEWTESLSPILNEETDFLQEDQEQEEAQPYAEDHELGDDSEGEQIGDSENEDEAPNTYEKIGYCVEWPDLDSQTEGEKADVATKQTQALTEYISGGLEQLIPPMDYLTRIMGFEESEAEAILVSAAENMESEMTMTDPQLGGAGEMEPPLQPLFDQDGNPVDQQGRPVDEFGNPVGPDGEPIDQFGNATEIDEEGNIVGPDGIIPIEEETTDPFAPKGKPPFPPTKNQLVKVENQHGQPTLTVPQVLVRNETPTPQVTINMDMNALNETIGALSTVMTEFRELVTNCMDRDMTPAPVVVNVPVELLVKAQMDANQNLVSALHEAAEVDRAAMVKAIENIPAPIVQNDITVSPAHVTVEPRAPTPWRIETDSFGNKRAVPETDE